MSWASYPRKGPWGAYSLQWSVRRWVWSTATTTRSSISHSHIDNKPFVGDPRGGWVDIFHEQLQNFVDVHVGRRTKTWRDKRLTGGEVFSEEIEQQLRSSAILVSIISPGYLTRNSRSRVSKPSRRLLTQLLNLLWQLLVLYPRQ